MTDPRFDSDEPVPLGFKIIVVLAGLYLLWRAIEGVGWLIGRVL